MADIAAFLRLCRWAGACLLLLTASPALFAATAPPLDFQPYALETESHGTIKAEVAFLDVPVRHALPEGPHMQLRVVRLPASENGGKAAPVVYLAGGPGGSGVAAARGARWPVFDEVRRHADVLLLDQRGTGLSQPPPACPYQHRFNDAAPMQRDTALTALRAVASRCIAHWKRRGVDLGAYTTAESADDIEALRQALNVPRISLWGMSYGTHLAMAAARRHEDGIDRLVLMGPEGPDQTLKLPLAADKLLAALATVAEKEGFTDLVGSATRVLAALCRAPVKGRSLMHRGRQVTLGCLDAQLAISASLGRRSTQQMLPLMLRHAEQGDYDLLAALVLSLREQLGTFQAMPLAMEVASAQSADRREQFRRQAGQSLFGEALSFPFPMLADGLGLVELGPAFRAPFHTERPTLIVSGTLDGRTPVANAEALLPGFHHASDLRVVNASHDDELWLGNPDMATTISSFIAGASLPHQILLDVPKPSFHTNLMQVLVQVTGVGRWVVMALVGAMLLLVGLVMAVAFRLRRNGRRRSKG